MFRKRRKKTCFTIKKEEKETPLKRNRSPLRFTNSLTKLFT